MTNLEGLEITTPSDRELAMTRCFNAPRHLLFAALTTPELVVRWLLGPPGWSMEVCSIDLRVGGTYRYEWRKADGAEMAVSGVYREIEAPARIVHSELFDDPWYQGEALVTTTLSEEAGRTTMTMSIRCESKAVRDGMLASGMEKGMVPSYARLDAVLAELAAAETRSA